MSDAAIEQKVFGLADGILPSDQIRDVVDLCGRA
jgi:hypothetical protein